MNRSYKGLEVRIKSICELEGQLLYKLQIFLIEEDQEYPKRLFVKVDGIVGDLEDVYQKLAVPWIDQYKKEEEK